MYSHIPALVWCYLTNLLAVFAASPKFPKCPTLSLAPSSLLLSEPMLVLHTNGSSGGSFPSLHTLAYHDQYFQSPCILADTHNLSQGKPSIANTCRDRVATGARKGAHYLSPNWSKPHPTLWQMVLVGSLGLQFLKNVLTCLNWGLRYPGDKYWRVSTKPTHLKMAVSSLLTN